MQKIITVAVDTTQLNPGNVTPFAINELTEVNELLELGWQIEEWDFLKEGETDGQVVLLVILNDERQFENDEDEFDLGFDDVGVELK
jgi:hypothetical protein